MYNPQITVDRIKEIRTSKGISLAELNEACGLNKNTITVSANSKTGLSAKILSDVSKFLGCSVDYLLGETDNNIEKSKYEPLDPMTQILIAHFNKLSPQDKIDFLNEVVKKTG